MRRHVFLIATALGLAASAVSAEFSKVDNQSEFVALVAGKTLGRPFIRLEVSPEGTISGTGAAWEVSGNWTWNDGYFCRNLVWGGDELGYNCQRVDVRGGKIRFTSDRGTGDSAEFTVR